MEKERKGGKKGGREWGREGERGAWIWRERDRGSDLVSEGGREREREEESEREEREAKKEREAWIQRERGRLTWPRSSLTSLLYGVVVKADRDGVGLGLQKWGRGE